MAYIASLRLDDHGGSRRNRTTAPTLLSPRSGRASRYSGDPAAASST
jgi:hypothetical protein